MAPASHERRERPSHLVGNGESCGHSRIGRPGFRRLMSHEARGEIPHLWSGSVHSVRHRERPSRMRGVRVRARSIQTGKVPPRTGSRLSVQPRCRNSITAYLFFIRFDFARLVPVPSDARDRTRPAGEKRLFTFSAIPYFLGIQRAMGSYPTSRRCRTGNFQARIEQSCRGRALGGVKRVG